MSTFSFFTIILAWIVTRQELHAWKVDKQPQSPTSSRKSLPISYIELERERESGKKKISSTIVFYWLTFEVNAKSENFLFFTLET